MTILPGSTIGIFGSGQLGRMFSIAAQQMGYVVHVFSPDKNSPAGQVANLEIQADYDDRDAVVSFARGVDVITLEFENIPVDTLATASQFAPVHPDAELLRVTQNRIAEKTFLRNHQIPVGRFAPVRDLESLRQGITEFGGSGLLKTATMGYDGKGQVWIEETTPPESAWQTLGQRESILEEIIEYELEFSIIAARNAEGQFAAYNPIINQHKNQILHISRAPADLDKSLTNQAIEIVRSIFDAVEAIGVICVEFFLSTDGRILVNEIAPRCHNSGHLTIDAHATSQFEQQVRAVCNLPLGATEQIRPAAMLNLLGNCWNGGQPAWDALLTLNDVKLHLYGKNEPRPGRKMGHVTALSASVQKAVEQIELVEQRLTQNESVHSS